jgi:hypothetical protein
MVARRGCRPPFATLAVVGVVLSGCGAPVEQAAAPDAAPFAGLLQCADAPFIGAVIGLTEEGSRKTRNGELASTDIYGIRPDGSAVPVSRDLGSYDFGLSADATTLYARPDPERPNDVSSLTVPDQILAIDTRSERRTVLLTAPGADLSRLTPSPDGSQLAVAAVTEAQLETGSGAHVAFVSLDPPSKLSWAPGDDPSALLYVGSLAWRADGRSLGYASLIADGYELRILDLDTGQDRVLYQGVGNPISLDWSSDGGLILVEEAGIDESNLALARAREVSVDSGASQIVMEGPAAELKYAAADASRIVLFDEQDGGTVVAQAWTRADDGTFELTSSAPFGQDVGLIGVSRPSFARCALA